MSMKGLMTEENETVHQIECEMQRLLTIITNDQELIKKKDQQITSLQNSLNNKDDSLKKKEENDFKKYMDEIIIEKDLEWKNHIDEKEFELFNSKLQLDEHKRVIEDYLLEIETLKSTIEKQLVLSETHEILKSKMSDLMKIIDQQNKQIAILNEKETDQETLSQRNEILQKEMHVLKVTLQQKDLDIKSLNQMLETRDDTIKDKNEEIKEINIKLSESEKKEEIVIKLRKNLSENEEKLDSFKTRLISEQENNKQTEDELIKLKMEFDELKLTTSDSSPSSNSDEKDALIEKLQKQIEQEQQIVAHVQFVQEKEIIEKEKEIAFLHEELRTEKERSDQFKNQINSQYSKTELNMDDTENESDTVTFHDAVSDNDDPDMLLEDLEYD